MLDYMRELKEISLIVNDKNKNHVSQGMPTETQEDRWYYSINRNNKKYNMIDWDVNDIGKAFFLQKTRNDRRSWQKTLERMKNDWRLEECLGNDYRKENVSG